MQNKSSAPESRAEENNQNRYINSSLLEVIPAVLAATPNWVLWQAVPKPNGKIDKVPYSALTGQKCDVTNSANHASIERALAYLKQDRNWLSGIGFCLTQEVGAVGLDLDHALNKEGDPLPWVAPILAALPAETYVEVSPSGHGLRAFFRGVLQPGRRSRKLPEGKIELYDQERFLTVTGNRFGTGCDVPASQETIDYLQGEWLEITPANSEQDIDFISVQPERPDEEVLSRMFNAKNGETVKRLWDGHVDEHNDDDSAADQALLCHLAFWTGKNVEQMERLFDKSTLGERDKWQNREDYRKRSIEQAIQFTKQTYKPTTASNDEQGRILTDFELQAISKRIQEIDPLISHTKLPNRLKDIIEVLTRIDEAQAVAILEEEIQKHFGLRRKDLEPYRRLINKKRKQLSQEPEEARLTAGQALQQLGSMQLEKELHPALDFVDGILYVGTMIRGQHFLISSERQLLETYGGHEL